MNEKFIEAYVGRKYYVRGNRLYQEGNVGDLYANEDPDTGLIIINAEVESSTGDDYYHVEITLSKDENWILDCTCTCPFYEENMVACKHIAAVLLKYIDSANTSIIGNGYKAPKKKQVTSYELSNLISEYAKNQYIPSKPQQPVKLEPSIQFTQNQDAHIQFKIYSGTGHKYVLQNITSFVECISNNENCRYGKGLEFIHNMNAFHPSYHPLIQFLCDLVNNEDQFLDQSFSYYNSYVFGINLSPKRDLALKGYYLDQFFDRCKDIPIYIPAYKNNYHILNQELTVIETDPHIQLSLRKQDDGYEVIRPYIQYARGKDYLYFLKSEENILIKTPFVNHDIIPVLDYLTKIPSKNEFISADDLPAFSKFVYPVMQKALTIDAEDFNQHQYLPDKPRFEIYLDLPQDDMITCDLVAVYSKDSFHTFNHDDTSGNRDMEEEIAMESEVSPWFNAFDPNRNLFTIINDDEYMYHLLTDGITVLQSKATVFISDKLKKLQVKEMPKFSIGVSVSNDLLQLDFVSETLSTKQLAEIMSRYTPKKKFYRLKNGEFFHLDDSIEDLATLSDSLSLNATDIAKGSVTIPKFRASLIDEYVEASSNIDFTPEESFRTYISNMHKINQTKHELPKDLNATLRHYQEDGFNWLCRLKDNGFAGLLADEMGLGKTLQVISFLGSWADRKRCLIVCPASLVYNWSSEIRKFMPSLQSVMINGAAPIRKELIQNSKEKDIIITSYDLLKRDIDLYKDMKFSCEVIDEAQYIKNAGTQASKAVKNINAEFRIALTGTPIENKLSELWSIFDYLLPGFFYGYQRFRSEFELPIIKDGDSDTEAVLKKMISPFVLRRLKKDVLKDLPEKLEEVYYAPLEDEQKDLYEARVQRLKLMLTKQSDKEFKENKILVLAELTRLRQLCCDPSLVYEGYKNNSAKSDLCIDLIKNAIEGGHKILLFSQFTSMLDILTTKLKKNDIPFYLLEGSTPKNKRAEMVEQFQQDDVPVFCISLKAGGTGLNLTAADIVIHYDPWWNTAVENQASDRAHRIGQKNVVSVYRLIMKDTIEERILNLQQTKSDLANRILSGESISSATFTREDLLALL